MSDGLLTPGSPRTDGLVDDAALLAAMVRVEVAWLRALATDGGNDADVLAKLADDLASGPPLDVREIADRTEAAGNPVPPVVDVHPR